MQYNVPTLIKAFGKWPSFTIILIATSTPLVLAVLSLFALMALAKPTCR